MTVSHRNPELTADTVDRLLFWIIAGGCAGFIFILTISAVWDHSIILLHAFQSLQYLAVVALAARRNRWGYFIGIAVAALWDYGGLFVSGFVASGLRALGTTIETGVLTKPDQIIAVFGFTFHLMIIVACALAYLRLANRKPSDGGRLLVSLAGAIGYFYVIIALFQPRYLSMFPRLLHPHAPF